MGHLFFIIFDQFWLQIRPQNHPKSLRNRLRGAPGTPWGPFLKQGHVWGPFIRLSPLPFGRFWGALGTPFTHIFAPSFETLFWTPSLIALKRSWVDFGSILGAILAAFLDIFLGLAAKVKIELPFRRELNFQGSGPPQIDIFSILFLCPSWERLRILLFPNFGRFWARFGVHLGLLGRSFSNLFFIIFLGYPFKADFGQK